MKIFNLENDNFLFQIKWKLQIYRYNKSQAHAQNKLHQDT